MRVSFLTVALLTSYATAQISIHGAVSNGTDDTEPAGFFTAAALNMADHPFVAPTDTDSRTPCPALNSLANHGFLPHDGKAITPDVLKESLRSVYGLSFALATGLVESGWQSCGQFVAGKKAPTDLHEFAQHNKIEHDASLAHADVTPGEKYAPVEVDQGLLQDFVSRSADGQFLTMEDVARVRVEREDALPVPLETKGVIAATGEGILLLNRIGDSEKVSVSDVQTFLGESRLPDSYTGPKGSMSFITGGVLIAKLTKAMADIRG